MPAPGCDPSRQKDTPTRHPVRRSLTRRVLRARQGFLAVQGVGTPTASAFRMTFGKYLVSMVCCSLIPVVVLVLTLVAGPSRALEPGLEYSLRDGPIPDGTADDLFLPVDSDFGRVYLSFFFDAEHYAEFVAIGGSTTSGATLRLMVTASNIDLVYGESKTFLVSAYSGDGVASPDPFGSGSAIESVTLATNGAWEVEIDVTDSWNDAVLAGEDYFGIRILDPVWTGTAVEAGEINVDAVGLEGVPEPGFAMSLGVGLTGLAAATRRAARRRRAIAQRDLHRRSG